MFIPLKNASQVTVSTSSLFPSQTAPHLAYAAAPAVADTGARGQNDGDSPGFELAVSTHTSSSVTSQGTTSEGPDGGPPGTPTNPGLTTVTVTAEAPVATVFVSNMGHGWPFSRKATIAIIVVGMVCSGGFSLL
ncbi:hypothetical protein C8R46DRAFT_1209061 [Mycena filopes]|nr:hypothetical protein C8R46DRAFT_1209061 [Mycena filopes]